MNGSYAVKIGRGRYFSVRYALAHSVKPTEIICSFPVYGQPGSRRGRAFFGGPDHIGELGHKTLLRHAAVFYFCKRLIPDLNGSPMIGRDRLLLELILPCLNVGRNLTAGR